MKNLSQAAIEAVADFRVQVPECVGAGIVELTTSTLLAVDTADNHPRVVLDMLSAATTEFFQGRSVVMIEDMFKRQRGVHDDRHYFQEILINSTYLCHLFVRSQRLPDLVGVVVSRNTVNLATLFSQTRAIMIRFESAAARP